MGSSQQIVADVELDGWIERFEREASQGDADVADFLPDADHPQYLSILRELLRVDLEFAWDRGVSRRLEDYADRFPALFANHTALGEVAIEEFRQRKAAGEAPDPAEYRRRFQIELPLSDATSELSEVSSWDGHQLPEVGDTIPPGYRLREELGRGAFGRVYLAEQADLADRLVAIKISSRLIGEAQTLARLQHTHIVPVYSVHRVGGYQALVMPYLGRKTLAEVLSSSQATERSAVTRNVDDSGPSTTAATRPGHSREPLALNDQLRIAIALADGLSHAHERGILHRDIKPANILLADDRQPMLLDFNLATEENQNANFTGGTPRYMSPEQLRSLSGTGSRLDARSDLYSFGIVLHELFLGQPPFPDRKGTWAEIVPVMVADREQVPACEHPSSAMRAILRKCLQPHLDDRYASAALLRDDLKRHAQHQPLTTAKEPWSRERLRKWVRRHPRLSSATSVASLALVLLLLLGAGAYRLQIAKHEAAARDARRGIATARDDVQAMVVDPHAPERQFREAKLRVEQALVPYEGDDWLERRSVRRLPASEVEPLRIDMAELLFYGAEATTRLAEREADASQRQAYFDEALQWNSRAAKAYPDERPLRATTKQRAWILDRAGRTDESEAIYRDLPRTIIPGGAGVYVEAHADIRDRRFDDAIVKLELLTRQGRASYQAWMALGTARLQSHRGSAAADAFLVASALEPESAWPWFYRGVALIEAGRPDLATEALARFVEREPDEATGRLNLALAQLLDRQAAKALETLAKIEGPRTTRWHGLRERALTSLNRHEEAVQEHRSLLASLPRDVDDWTIRGEARAASEPANAVADFDAALAIDPDHPSALRGKASCLSEELRRPADAVAVLEHLVQTPGGRVEDQAGLAVLLARLKRPEEARAQVKLCLGDKTPAVTLYQAASALAILATTPAERLEAIAVLRRVIRLDASWATHMPTDPDLLNLRDETSFKDSMAAARVIAKGTKDE